MGVRQALFPAPTLGAPASAGLPASRRHSPRQAESPASWQGRPTPCDVEFRVRLFSSLRPVVAPPACEPGQDTSAICSPRLDHLALVGHRFWRRVCHSHGSRLLTLRLPFAHRPAVPFLASPTHGSFSRGLPSRRGLPGSLALFVHLSMAFIGRSQTVDRIRQSRSPRADTQSQPDTLWVTAIHSGSKPA